MPALSIHQHPRPNMCLPDTLEEASGPQPRRDQSYAELSITTNFTFLKGASHPEEYMLKATELGLEAIAITDVNSMAGVVRAFSARKQLSNEVKQNNLDLKLPRLIPGARLVFQDTVVEWVALPTDRQAYERLTRLLTLGKRRSAKGECKLYKSELLQWGKGLVLIALPPRYGKTLEEILPELQCVSRSFPMMTFLGAAPNYDGCDQRRLAEMARLAQRAAIPMVAVGDVLMHQAKRRMLADVLTCLRLGIRIDEIGENSLPNSERRLKGHADMLRLFRNHPGALRRSVEIANRCFFDLADLSYEYPDEISGDEDPQTKLERLAREGLERRCPQDIPERYRALMEKELKVIGELNYAPYFLTVHEIVSYARSQGILCQGRGSAANSIICWSLGITDVSPDMIGMVFERFISRHRGEPPDIDVDFEHERREEIIQWIYQKYGRDRAGLCATVIHFRTRAAIREVGKVMGLGQDVLSALTGRMWGSSSEDWGPNRLKEVGLNPDDKRLRLAIELVNQLVGFPRHLSQHVGGFVITRKRLDELCPIENAAMDGRTVIEWDKDDIDALGILKVDILSLGMLTCIRKAFELLSRHEGRDLSLATVPQEDPDTYDMLCKADAVGVFQVESRAQMNFLPRMLPRTFYDLVIEVAIVRPGPIQGGMVQPYIRRRQKLEKPEPFGPALMEVTRKTLGVPLFQEQALQIAVVGAGYSAEEAEQLRRSLASFRRMGTIAKHKDRFIEGMLQNGYDREVAERCFSQIEGFADYGFPESHAAAFAMLTYVSSWIKCHYPAIFACALLNSQPMGFYAPAQIIRDVRDHGIDVRSICVNHSGWENQLERRSDGQLALRLGFRQIKGFRKEEADWIVAARGNGYPDPASLWLRAGLTPSSLERLAEADAFIGNGLSRREALWQVRALKAKPLPLFSDPIDGEGIVEPDVNLPLMHLGEEVVEDYLTMRLTLRAHPMELLRPSISNIAANDTLRTIQARYVSVCGLVITRQRPGTASGVIFLTLEDETGVANVIVWPKTYEKYRPMVIGGRLLRVSGRLQREGIVVHVIADKIEDISYRLRDLGHPLESAVGITNPEADEAPRSRPARSHATHPREQSKNLFPSRDFH